MFRALRERIEFAWIHTLHKLSRTTVERYQLRALNRLVPYVRAHVPLYAQLYADMPSAPIASFAAFAAFPLSQKSLYTTRPVEEALDTSRFIPSVWHTTSGTSGEPFTVHRGGYPTHPFYEEFYTLRFLHWKGLPIQHFPRVRIAHVQIHETKRAQSLYVSVSGYLSDPARAIEKIKAFNPEVLTSYASILIDIADHEAAKEPHERLRVAYAASFGEMLSPDARAHIAGVLGCEVFTQYGLEEIGAVGVECAEHNGYHVNPETVYAEVVREDGSLAHEGEQGRVVLTNLLNNRMPFIRYESGDTGTITRATCACGLKTPRLYIEGRRAGYLSFSGTRIHHLEFDEAMDSYVYAVRKYQIAKMGEQDITVRVVSGTHYSDDVEARVRSAIQALVGDDVRVHIDRVRSIAPAARGKSNIIVDESLH